MDASVAGTGFWIVAAAGLPPRLGDVAVTVPPCDAHTTDAANTTTVTTKAKPSLRGEPKVFSQILRVFVLKQHERFVDHVEHQADCVLMIGAADMHG